MSDTCQTCQAIVRTIRDLANASRKHHIYTQNLDGFATWLVEKQDLCLCLCGMSIDQLYDEYVETWEKAGQ